MNQLQKTIETAWDNRTLLEDPNVQESIRSVINQLDQGDLRVAEPTQDGWQVNEWVKKAVVLYFPIQGMETLSAGPLEFHDKIPLKISNRYSRFNANLKFASLNSFPEKLLPGPRRYTSQALLSFAPPEK